MVTSALHGRTSLCEACGLSRAHGAHFVAESEWTMPFTCNLYVWVGMHSCGSAHAGLASCVLDGFAIAGNVLLLRGHINVHSDMSALSADDLVQMVAERIIAANPVVRNALATHLLPAARCLATCLWPNAQTPGAPNSHDLEQALTDVLSVLPKLRVGLDVNVKFQSYDFVAAVLCMQPHHLMLTFPYVDLKISNTHQSVLFSICLVFGYCMAG